MAHLSQKKGGYPQIDQHDRTCIVAVSETSKKIERGSVICVNENGEFDIAADAKKKPLYLALQNYNDLQANMAGFFSIGNGSPDAIHEESAHGSTVVNGPAITGIHLDDGDVWQTDMFDEDPSYAIGTPVTVKNGKFTPVKSNDDIVGYVRAVPYTRYSNDAVAVPGIITGAMIRVIDIEVA
jgi:hypothetical protein